MKMYLVMAFVAGIGFVGWKIYAAGFETAELRNQAQAAVALRDALLEERDRSERERQARAAAEARAEEHEAEAERRALRYLADQQERPECPASCYAVEWP